METPAPAQAENAAPTPEAPQSETSAEIALPPPGSSLKEYGEKIAELLKETPETPETPAPVAETPETPADPEVEKPETEEESVDTEETETPAEPEAKKFPNRISTAQFTDQEKEALALQHEARKNGDMVPSFKEAIEIVEARHEEKPVKVAAKIDPNPIRAQLAELKAKRAEALKTLGLDEVVDIERQQDELNAQLETARAEQAAQRESLMPTLVQSRNEALTVFPSAAQQDTPLGKEINALVTEMRQKNHPDLSEPDAPMLVAQRAAARLATRQAKEQGIPVSQALASLMAAKAPVKAVTPPVKTEPVKPKITPASGAAATPPPTTTTPKVLDLNSPDAMDPRKIEEYFNSGRKNSGFVLRH